VIKPTENLERLTILIKAC